MIVMEKAFEVKTKIMSAARISELSALLPFKSGDLVLTESRLAPQLQLPDFVSVMVRDDLGRGPNTEELVEKAVHAAGANCSRVIGIGGGAVLDLAKLLSLEQVLPLHESFTQPQDLRRSRELVLIPTTPGTGSEVTPYSAVYFPDLGAQLVLNSAALSADAALLCPEFLTDIPFKIFAASSFDAFTHAFESYLSALATPFSRVLALQAIKDLISSWQHIAGAGVSAMAAELAAVQLAGTMAGISYANAGCAAVHALAYPLCTRLKIKHGEANYLVFDAVCALYQKKNPQGALADIQRLLAALFNCPEDQAFSAFSALCQSLLPRQRLSACGMQERQILEFTDMVLTRQHMLIANGYIPLSAGDITAVYRQLL